MVELYHSSFKPPVVLNHITQSRDNYIAFPLLFYNTQRLMVGMIFSGGGE